MSSIFADMEFPGLFGTDIVTRRKKKTWLTRVQHQVLKNSAWLNSKIFVAVITVYVKPQTFVSRKSSASEAVRCLKNELK